MQLTAAATNATGQVVASQTIDMNAKEFPGGGAVVWSTEREYRLAGAKDGIDVFTGLDDALAAASLLSAGSMPGLAVVKWRGGYRIHDVHASSRTYRSTSTHAPVPPMTRETSHSSVPFAAGNVRAEASDGRNAPLVLRDQDLVALVDGDRRFVRAGDRSWAGRPVLVEA
ncbi:MAG: hypothetical protein KDC46_01640 [Thermoleophilia bacterium]|nr:hypothetical protein [Thermoleophilia bacterium]